MQDGWETTSLVRSSDSGDLNVTRSNGTVKANIIGKRSVEITNEEPEPKRRKKVESVELHADLAATLQLVLAQEFSPLDENWQSEKFFNLSEPSVKYLLSSDDLIVQSENTVFHALMYWMEQNDVDPVSLEDTNDLLAAVRFKLVTIDYLYNVIKNHPIASKMPKFMELYLAGMTYHAILQGQKKLLKDQPVVRKKSEVGICQHTFVIKKEDYDNARENPKFKWNEFWACGYKMSLGGSFSNNYYRPDLRLYTTINREI